MRKLFDIPRHKWPSPMPLHLTPRWMFIMGWPLWRYRDDKGWVYVPAAQYDQVFRRVA